MRDRVERVFFQAKEKEKKNEVDKMLKIIVWVE